MLPDTLANVPAAAALREYNPEAIVDGAVEHGEATLVIDPARIRPVCEFLRRDRGFERLSGITAVDWYPAEPRFEVVYLVHSISRNERLRLKCRLSGEAPAIDSVTSVWRGADWYEREVFDLFGVTFREHPNPKRIMLPQDWEGHPLRKDYPVHGHKYDYKEEAG